MYVKMDICGRWWYKPSSYLVVTPLFLTHNCPIHIYPTSYRMGYQGETRYSWCLSTTEATNQSNGATGGVLLVKYGPQIGTPRLIPSHFDATMHNHKWPPNFLVHKQLQDVQKKQTPYYLNNFGINLFYFSFVDFFNYLLFVPNF
jgi:hypothetical protein